MLPYGWSAWTCRQRSIMQVAVPCWNLRAQTVRTFGLGIVKIISFASQSAAFVKRLERIFMTKGPAGVDADMDHLLHQVLKQLIYVADMLAI